MIVIALILYSCQRELDFNDTEVEQPPVIENETKKIQNGRFVFSSVSALEETIEELQKTNPKIAFALLGIVCTFAARQTGVTP